MGKFKRELKDLKNDITGEEMSIKEELEHWWNKEVKLGYAGVAVGVAAGIGLLVVILVAAL